MSLIYPGMGAVITKPTTVTVTGSIIVSNGAQAPVSVRTLIDGYEGTGGCILVAPNSYAFYVGVYIPPEAPTGNNIAVSVDGSTTNDGKNWGNAGTAAARVTIQ